MSCGCGSCMFVEYGGGATGVDSTELDHEPAHTNPITECEPCKARDAALTPAPPAPAETKEDEQDLCEACERAAAEGQRVVGYGTPGKCPNCGKAMDDGERDVKKLLNALRPPLAPAPAPEATGEMSEAEFHAAVLFIGGDITKLRAHDAALRTRAREAEEREAKWRRELSAACELSERAREIVVSALNQPPEHFYDKHDNGEWSAEHIAFAIRSLFDERDEAREQHRKLAVEVAEALAASTAPGTPSIVEAMQWELDHHKAETIRRGKLMADLAAAKADAPAAGGGR